MERFLVVGLDGSHYGPATAESMNQWIVEGRIYPSTVLINEQTGQRIVATDLPSLRWPPPAVGFGVDPYPRPNYAIGYAQQVELPEQVRRKWNWGAFAFSWIWGLNHKAYYTFLTFIPYIGFIFAFWCGIKGNEWAWQSGRFRTVEEMEACQVVWAKWALAYLLLFGGLSALMLLVSLILSFQKN